MSSMEYAIEQVANALHGDQCAEDPDPGERCNCGADDFYRQAEIALDTLSEVGLLAPATLREEWAAIDDDGHVLMRYGADSHSPHREYGTSLTYSRWASDWKPWEDDR